MTRTLHHTTKAATVRNGVRKHTAKKVMRRIGREQMMDTLREVTHELDEARQVNERAERAAWREEARRNERPCGITYN